MTFKYLWLMGHCEKNKKNLHIPVDNIIIKKAKENGVNPPDLSWSKWNYEEYLEYQKNLQDLVAKQNITYIEWEYDNWN